MTSSRATSIGLAAILMWSLLAVLTVITGRVPPFQLAAMTFAIGAGVGYAGRLLRRDRGAAKSVPPRAWMLGVAGLFGYHALYFLALRTAPPAEAGLLNHLWPLLIVLFSGLLPGEQLRWHHVAGALLGLIGTVVLLSGGLSRFEPGAIGGLAAAFVAAFVWAGYSVLSRRMQAVPTDAVAGFCLVTAILAAVCHLVLETTAWPSGAAAWVAVAALGLGPVGLAFYAWDIGIKRGDIRVLGAASYAAPLLSTFFLIAAGYAEAGPALLVAALLIAGGGVLAAKDMLTRR